ncbi:MAG: hypothetical protein ACLVMH_11985 [Christensenellales bacterium]
MTLQTNPAERREMVQAISERLGSPAVYLRTPTCAYRIGGLTVERDGSIISDDDALLEALRPMLIERGWLTDAEASVTKTEPTEQDSEITQMELSFPVEDWTVPQLKNFLHTLYSNQHILRRMMQSDALYIDRQMMERLDEAQTPADLEARLADGLATGLLKGCRIQDGRFTLEAIQDDRDPARWQVYATLLCAILEHAKAAKRVFLRADADPVNEKYRANSFLMRLGFGGPEHKPLRRVLLGHLNGYAAFRSAAGMQAHREKYAQLRRKQREEARP